VTDLPPGAKIFGTGLSKTGTTSLWVALGNLGYRAGTYRHLKKIKPSRWLKGDFSRDYLADYDALTDLPIATYFGELDRRYPGSKFIHTVREIESWLDSARRHYARRPDRRAGWRRDVRVATYGISGFEHERFRFVYEAHNRNVREYFRERPGDLVVMDLRAGEGWKELCGFLGREIPDKSFPHVQPGHQV
jgi:hypothetical protein